MSEEREEYRPVIGFEGLYEVSNLGNVRSLDRVIRVEPKDKSPYDRLVKGRVLKPTADVDGYLMVGLYRDASQAICRVHRLVLQAFRDNPDNLPQVDHIDGNRANNHLDNLRWCTNEQNTHYGLERRGVTSKRHPPKTQYEKVHYEEETWVDVKGSNGLYRVSSEGNVYSVERHVVKSNGVVARFGGRMLKQYVYENGVPVVNIEIDGCRRPRSVALIVAENLVPNPNGLDVVVHEDGDSLNNKAENLYWGTRHDIGYQNYELGIMNAETQRTILRSKDAVEKNRKATSRPVVRDDGKWYASIREATEDLGCYENSICSHLSGRLKSIYGHTFTYADQQPA